MKILVVFGTRPEAIKLAPLILELKRQKNITTEICITAQHRSMLDSVLELFDIAPNYDLNIMQQNQDLFDISARILGAFRAILESSKPHMIIVHGDTTTTFIAALGAFYAKIPVAHLEAGLRTHKIYNPFPEELNRTLTSDIAALHFAPTKLARQNLIAEGINKKNIKIVGNSVIDALKIILGKITKERATEIANALPCDINQPFILVTAHRRESFGKDMENIAHALKVIAQKLPHIHIIYPLHLNPNIRAPMQKILGHEARIHLIEPLDYASFAFVMSKCFCILTDSGGIQEEATFLHKPTLILRNTTERKEALKCRTLRLIGTKKERIIKETLKLFASKKTYAKMANPRNSLPYGCGDTAKRAIKWIKKYDFNSNL